MGPEGALVGLVGRAVEEETGTVGAEDPPPRAALTDSSKRSFADW